MPLLILLLPIAALALYLYSSDAAASISSDFTPWVPGADAPVASLVPDVPSYAAGLLDSVGTTMDKIFQVPAAGAPYADAIAKAEIEHGIPQSLLARTLYQESRFKPDIISGKVKSPTGAIGIAQFEPATAADLGVDPRDPFAAIDAAAEYLRAQFDKFGTWSGALMAYNWGSGNVRSFQRTGKGAKGQPLPLETQNYVTQILGDVTV